MNHRSVIIVGSGFAGLSAACFMAKYGWKVTVIEKNSGPGGRAKQLKTAGFTFDMGPSFYWMPGVFERFFSHFGKSVSDYYQLERLDPSYRVYWNDGFTDMPARYEEVRALFESIEKGAAVKLDKYLKGAEYKYRTGMENLVYKPGLSVTEFLDADVIKGALRLQILTSVRNHVNKYFQDPRLRQIMEFPVLFLGALPQDTPALYSLMNYADIVEGTWYPKGGMYSVVDGMYRLALELGVEFRFNEPVQSFGVTSNRVNEVITSTSSYHPDAVISGADYHFSEKNFLTPGYRSYSEKYWEKRVMAPSCLMYYVGLNRKLKHAPHHSLFFDVPFDLHGKEIYKTPKWPTEPLFYVSVSSKTDNTVAPEGHENLVFLVPVAAGLEGDTVEIREKYFEKICDRMEKITGENIRDAIVVKESFSVSDFQTEYNSFRGNAYGLANTLKQTAILRPSCRSRKVNNLFYTGQLTVPGPGVPPSLISGEVVAKQLIKTIR